VAYNPDPASAKTVTFKDGTGATIHTMTVPPRTLLSSAGSGLASTPSDLSLHTPNNRFFLKSGTAADSTKLPQNGTLVRGASVGEYAVQVPAAARPPTSDAAARNGE
jgi:hypothetical protein